MLQGIDTVVVDLQDIGARFYTYPSTIAYVMEEAAKRKIAVVVLDRPNPLGEREIALCPRRCGPLPPGVIAAPRDAKQPTQQRDRMVRLLRLDKRERR